MSNFAIPHPIFYVLLTKNPDLGIAVEMNYNKDGSGASITSLLSAMKKYFGYSKYGRVLNISDLGEDVWNSRLRAEIDANRPVLYSASDEVSGGHAFVIDGYKDETFSVNWGWGGYCNGYYRIGALNPEFDGNPIGDKYNVGQSAVFQLEPSDGKEQISPLRFFDVDGQINEVNMNVTKLEKNKDVTILLPPLLCQSDSTFYGDLCVIYVPAEGKKSVLYEKSFKSGAKPNSYYTNNVLQFKSKVDAQPGDSIFFYTHETDSKYMIEIRGFDFAKMRLSATGFTPKTFELKAQIDEGATLVPASDAYNSPKYQYEGKPILGSNYFFGIERADDIKKCIVEVDGKTPLSIDAPESSRG